jgi:hypothetical protein
MSSFLRSRRRTLAKIGRPMTLRRQTSTATIPPTYADVTVQGHLVAAKPDDVQGEVMQGDARVAILNDEIAATDWPGPPRKHDLVLVDGETWVVHGPPAGVYDGATLIGFMLHVRGGDYG